MVQTNVTDANDVIHGVALQPDGRVVVAGQAGTGPRFVVARYTADGKVTTNLSSDVDDARAVALGTNGRIVVAGSASGIGRGAFALVRYLDA